MVHVQKIQTHKIMIVKKGKIFGGRANSEDPDQTAPYEQSDLGMHCYPRPFCKVFRILEPLP